MPAPLKDALPTGLSETQHGQLSGARERPEELTATTIHGFCQTLIRSYAVEADIDPGAQVMDDTHAEITFGTVFDQWLRRRLMSSVASDDPIAVLSKEEPKIAIDWKSEVKPTDRDIEIHAAQLRVYMRATQAERGALVYFSSGQVRWLGPAPSEKSGA